MVIYGRDARIGPRSLKHLFSGNYRNPEANRLSGVYELSLRRASEAGSPGRILLFGFVYACAPKRMKNYLLIFPLISQIFFIQQTDIFYHKTFLLCV